MSAFSLNPEYLLQTFSYVGLGAVLFAETGLLLGFFLPGDTLLLPAGLFAASGHLNLWLVMGLASVMAVAGNLTGYLIGRRFGPLVFARQNRFFKSEYVERAREYMNTHGNQTIVLARFIPVIRTVVPTLAGTVGMDFRLFALLSVVGGVLWGAGVPLVGYFLGKLLPPQVLDRYILFIVVLVLVLSFVPVLLELLKHRRRTRGQNTPE